MAAMKDTVRDARRIIAGAEENNTLDAAIKEIPPTLTSRPEQKASEQIASVTADARKNQGFPGAAHVRCALPGQCPGILNP